MSRKKFIDLKAKEGSEESPPTSPCEEDPGDICESGSDTTSTTDSDETNVTREGTRDSEARRRPSPLLDAERVKLTKQLDKMSAMDKANAELKTPCFKHQTLQDLADDFRGVARSSLHRSRRQRILGSESEWSISVTLEAKTRMFRP